TVLAVDGGTDDEAVGVEAVADFEQAAPRGPGSPDEVVGLDVGGHEFARPVEGRLGDPADVLLVFGVDPLRAGRPGRRADPGHGQGLAVGSGQDDAEFHGGAVVLAGRGSDDYGHGRPPICSSGWWSPASASCLPRTDDLRPKTK